MGIIPYYFEKSSKIEKKELETYRSKLNIGGKASAVKDLQFNWVNTSYCVPDPFDFAQGENSQNLPSIFAEKWADFGGRE